MNRIHILGASGSGTTTLGKALGAYLPHKVMDTDDYFWRSKYDDMRQPHERLTLLAQDLEKHEQWIVTGAVCGWGNELKSMFELVIFLYVPSDVRLQRLQHREYERYGEATSPGGSKYEQSQAFLQWAALYDEAGMEVRSKALHEHWMSDLSCPIIRIEGEHTVEERVRIVLDYVTKG